MSFIDVAMGDAPELGMADEGRYDLMVFSAKIGDTKENNRRKLAVAIVITGDDREYEPIFETFVFPKKEDWEEEDGKLAKMFILKLKRFMYLFGCSWEASGFDVDQISGSTADNVMVKQEVGDDDVERNKIMFPRLEEGM